MADSALLWQLSATSENIGVGFAAVDGILINIRENGL